MGKRKYKIGILDDHPVITSGLQSILKLRPNFIPRFHCNDQETLLQELSSELSEVLDLLILDVVIPGVSGLELFEKVRKQHPNIKIIAYTSLTSVLLVENLLQLGVNGYVNKKQNPEILLQAIDSIMEDGFTYVPEDYKHLIRRKNEEHISLSSREKEILELIIQGLLTKEIAEKLSISKNTVDNHRANLFRKFQVKNVAELIKESLQLGYMKA